MKWQVHRYFVLTFKIHNSPYSVTIALAGRFRSCCRQVTAPHRTNSSSQLLQARSFIVIVVNIQSPTNQSSNQSINQDVPASFLSSPFEKSLTPASRCFPQTLPVNAAIGAPIGTTLALALVLPSLSSSPSSFSPIRFPVTSSQNLLVSGNIATLFFVVISSATHSCRN